MDAAAVVQLRFLAVDVRYSMVRFVDARVLSGKVLRN